MNTSLIIGFSYLLLGALCGGSFGLPSKYVRKETPWENLWGPFFFFVTLAIPLILGPMLVERFFHVFAAVGLAGVMLPLAFGVLWGAGSMTLGMSFAFIGLSLAYSLNYGAQIIFGAVAPMALHHRDRFLTPQGGVILAGIAVCVLGVVVSGRAGMLKDRSVQKDKVAPAGRPKMHLGLLLAIASGVLCACYGVAASYTGPLANAGQEHFGLTPWQISCATTAVILWGGAFSSCLYCAGLLTKNGTWKYFVSLAAVPTLLIALGMAFLHNGAIYLFNLGFPRLGDLGVSVGYAAFMSLAIIVGNIHGFRTGEWKGASGQSVRWILTGIAILIVGVCLLAYGNALGLRG